MKIKISNFLTYLVFIFCLSSIGQTVKPVLKNPPFVLKSFEYNRVVFYECNDESIGLIHSNNKLNKKIIKNSKELSLNQIDTLSMILKSSKPAKDQKNDFHTYLGIVYYLGDSIVGSINLSIRSDNFIFYYRAIKVNPNHWPNSQLTINLFQRQQLSYLCHEIGLNCKYPKAKR